MGISSLSRAIAQPMNTYQPVELDPGRWAIERLVDGVSQGFTFGRYPDEAEATDMAYAFASGDAKTTPS